MVVSWVMLGEVFCQVLCAGSLIIAKLALCVAAP